MPRPVPANEHPVLSFSFYSRTGMSIELSTEEKEIAADMAPLIKNANLESMKMIKEGILIAINELQLYEDPKGILCLTYKDVMKAIEDGYKDQVAGYEEAEKGTLASGDKDNLEQVHKITTVMWDTAIKKPLPTNNELDEMNRLAGRTPFSYNNNNNNNNNKNGGMYSSRKLKKSRKPKHK